MQNPKIVRAHKPPHPASIITAPPQPKKRKFPATRFIIAGAAIAAIVLLILLSQRSRRSFKVHSGPRAAPSQQAQSTSPGRPRNSSGLSNQSGSPGKGLPANPPPPSNPAKPNPRQKAHAQSYVDSAHRAISPISALKFYQIAISFNRNNIDAWYGLLNAYREAGRLDDAGQTRMEMKQHFGAKVFSVADIVRRFGTLADFSHDESGTARLEYRSTKAKPDHLLEETYKLTKALKPVCDCQSLSLYARSGASSGGLLVYTDLDPLPPTQKLFESQARITLLK
ncbi:MAG: hypothetical protein GF398_20105 [Chitinivibrionales bacterium]|nr:hypothetical protein [Chitinivibrionales bacterium]